jgi:chromosome partitioning protein
MKKIIVIANQKGGVGKTTTSVNLSTALAAAGYKVLLIDFDPQGNATTGVGVDKKDVKKSLYDVLLGRCTVSEALVSTIIPGLSLIPSHIELIGAEIELVSFKDREKLFKNAIAPYADMFDTIMIDCPPSMGLLTLNAFVAADSVIVPLQCEYYALEGLSYLIHSIQRIQQTFNPKLTLFGILLTMYDKRSSLCSQVATDVRKHLKHKVFDTVVPRNIKVSEAPSHGKPVLVYDVNCVGSQAYMKLAREIIKREEKIA